MFPSFSVLFYIKYGWLVQFKILPVPPSPTHAGKPFVPVSPSTTIFNCSYVPDIRVYSSWNRSLNVNDSRASTFSAFCRLSLPFSSQCLTELTEICTDGKLMFLFPGITSFRATSYFLLPRKYQSSPIHQAKNDTNTIANPHHPREVRRVAKSTGTNTKVSLIAQFPIKSRIKITASNIVLL